MIAWAFFTLLLLSDGEVREFKSPRFPTWQDCETARGRVVEERIPAGVEGRVIRICRSETKF